MSTPEPAPPPEQSPSIPAPPGPAGEPPPDEGSSLVPGLLVVYAAYLLWRGAHHQIPHGWRQVMLGLGLRGLVGAQLALVAARALGWQRRQAGRAGDELWPFVEDSIGAGVDAGLQTIAEALIWTDGHAGDVPVTKDVGIPQPGVALVPTMADPPELLAQMTALAVTNAAIFTAAQRAGWAKKTWVSRDDSRVRPTHVALNGRIVPLDGVFVSPSGAKLRYPGDPRAPIGEVINCRCHLLTSRQ